MPYTDMPYDDWKANDPYLEELPMPEDEFIEGEDHYEVEVEARGERAHKIEKDAVEHGLKATVGPDTVYIVGPYDKLFTLLATIVGMSPEEANKAMQPVAQNEGQDMGMNEDEINPVFDDDKEMRDEEHADPSGREWSSGLDEDGMNQEDDDLDQASMIETGDQKCLLCDNPMSAEDKEAHSFYGDEGSAPVCQSCAGHEPRDRYLNGDPVGTDHPEPQSVQFESNEFDKFMDVVVLKENTQKKVEAQDTPQRIYNKRYREKALNRMRVRRLP